MKYIKELLIILLISFIGEALSMLIPIPVPGCVYGLVLMFVLLCTHIIKLESVKTTAHYLVEIMPLMFIPAGVGLIDSFESLKPMLVSISIITIVTTILVMAVTGLVAKAIVSRKNSNLDEDKKENDDELSFKSN